MCTRESGCGTDQRGRYPRGPSQVAEVPTTKVVVRRSWIGRIVALQTMPSSPVCASWTRATARRAWLRQQYFPAPLDPWEAVGLVLSKREVSGRYRFGCKAFWFLDSGRIAGRWQMDEGSLYDFRGVDFSILNRRQLLFPNAPTTIDPQTATRCSAANISTSAFLPLMHSLACDALL